VKTLKVFAVVGVVIGIGFLGLSFFSSSNPENEVSVVIPRKTSLGGVCEILQTEGIIDSPTFLKVLFRVTGGQSRVRAGEFKFYKNAGALSALRTLYYSEPVLHALTVPEGWALAQIATAVEANQLGKAEKVMALATQKDWIKKLKIQNDSLEGFLFPDTYLFSKVDGEEKILEKMVSRFFEKFDESMVTRAKSMGFTVEQVVTLASIIEKETGSSGERELISSVFHNRLKKKMRLQSDPTTIYGVKNFDGNLTKKHLLTYSPYNTYKIPALPPGPIASPGLAALKAALYPADSKFLYFVSNNQGGHLFSENYKDHNSKVDKYQKSLGHARPPSSTKRPLASQKRKK